VDVQIFRSADKASRIGLINGTNRSNLINRNPAVFGTP